MFRGYITELNPGKLVRFLGQGYGAEPGEFDGRFIIVGKDPMGGKECSYPVKRNKIGLHIKSRLYEDGSRSGCEEVLFDETPRHV